MRNAATGTAIGSDRHVLSIAVMVVGSALAVAACGSSSGKPGAASPSRQAVGLRFSQCMRSHGVPNFPDPTSGQISLNASSGINPQSPAFQSAQSACIKLLPGKGPSAGHPSASEKLAMLNLARCMRAHGVPNFPDPTTTPPSPGSGGSQLVLGRGGVFIALPPGMSPSSPAFQQAAVACHFPMPHGGGPAAK